MGKSPLTSSSKKIKRSKDPSKLLSVKKKKKKKTKRIKSKKIRRAKDYSDESESSGSDSSLYSSSSDDDYIRDKRKYKLRKKKRSRRKYSSTESDDDDDDRVLKNKKRSKRKKDLVETKKKKKKSGYRKRRKRESSSSSFTSSDRSDEGSESDGKRNTKERGRLGNAKTAQRRSKDESGEDSEPYDDSWRQVEDEVVAEKNSRRLKSIVVVSYTYNDNDDDDRKVDTVSDRDAETTISYSRTRADEDSNSETSKDSQLDLEAVLKRRALENLKRFRGETLNSGTASKEEVTSVSEKDEESQDNGLMEQKKLGVSAGSKDLESSQKLLQVVDVKESETALANSSASRQDQQSGDAAMVKASSGISSCSTKRKLIRPVLGQGSLDIVSTKESSSCQDAEAESIDCDTIDKNCPQSSLAMATNNGVDNIEQTKVRSLSSSSPEPENETKVVSRSEQKTIDETKDESQYEQKTMTVMRGGEMVQVSYKVYIPKKASSLGRRKLKR
ncbi:unnamed protein product [Cochlearia groenlandica]